MVITGEEANVVRVANRPWGTRLVEHGGDRFDQPANDGQGIRPLLVDVGPHEFGDLDHGSIDGRPEPGKQAWVEVPPEAFGQRAFHPRRQVEFEAGEQGLGMTGELVVG